MNYAKVVEIQQKIESLNEKMSTLANQIQVLQELDLVERCNDVFINLTTELNTCRLAQENLMEVTL